MRKKKGTMATLALASAILYFLMVWFIPSKATVSDCIFFKKYSACNYRYQHKYT